MVSRRTVEDRVAEFGAKVMGRLRPRFDELDIFYPPEKIILLGLKEEKTLEVWVSGRGKPWILLKKYPIYAASGKSGPKLREGDRQVPEGIYTIESLNPNSRFHLALRVNYPNDYDRERAREDGRTNLGGDIMIHGNSVSAGCLAIGDEASEDLFVFVAEVGLGRVSLILSPYDFRRQDVPKEFGSGPVWLADLYARIHRAMLQISTRE